MNPPKPQNFPAEDRIIIQVSQETYSDSFMFECRVYSGELSKTTPVRDERSKNEQREMVPFSRGASEKVRSEDREDPFGLS